MIGIDTLESQRLEIQRQLDLTKTQDERNKLGQFATPSKLAIDILAYARSLIPSNTKLRFLDPAFGTGSFFSALLKIFPNSQIAEAEGYEVDPFFGHAAIELWKDKDLRLHIADFTQAVPNDMNDKKPNLLICNPPYVRHHHLSKLDKQRLQKAGEQATGIKLSRLTGLYGHFLCISHNWMAEDGLAGWLIPSEFMDVNYGQQIRAYLLTKVTLLRVHCFNPKDVQFQDALVSSSVVWFKKALPPTNHMVEFTRGGTLLKPEASEFIHAADLVDMAKWTKAFTFPRQACKDILTNASIKPVITIINSKDSHEVYKGKLAPRNLLLSDLFDIKRGLATGANDYFILNQEQISQHQLPMDFLTPVLPSPRFLEFNEVRSDINGYPLLDGNLFLLDCSLSEEEVDARYPTLWKYLQIGVGKGINKRYLCSSHEPWYIQEKRPGCMFLCAYMGRQNSKKETPFRFILNHSRATATNAYHILYPKPFLLKALENNSKLANAIWQALQSITSKTLIDEGRVYGGGLHKMEPKELANVPADGFLTILQNYSVSMPDTLFSVVLGIQDIAREKVVFPTLWTRS